MQDRTEPVVSIRNVDFSYRQKSVFTDLDTDIPAGLTALVGENGAGKTTLFKLLLGDIRPAGGQLTIFGEEVGGGAGERIREHVGYLPQAFGFVPGFTVSEFVGYFAWLRGVPRRSRTEQVRQAIDAVGLTERAGTPLKALSGGMLRRAGIAQALVHRPRLLLLDEPTVGLDPAQRVALRDLLRALAADTSVVLSTHLMEDVGSIADHVLVLADGAIRFSGPPEELSALGGGSAGHISDLEKGFLTLTTGRG